MKDNLKRIFLTFTAIVSSISTYAISGGGIAAATLGSVAAATMVGVGVHKARHRHETKIEKLERKKTNTIEKIDKQKKKIELRKQIANKKTELNGHKHDLKKLKKSGKSASPEAQQHRSIIQDLEKDIERIKEELKNIL